MGKFASSIARIAKYRLIRAVIRGIVDAIKEGAENFYNFSKAINDKNIKFASSMDSVKAAASTMKNQLGSAFGSLFAAVAPIIIKLIDLITRLANVLAMLFARLSGAKGWYKATNGANTFANAAGGAGKAAKEAIKYLAPFDELNRLPSDNKSGGGGGGGSSGSSGGDYEWVPFEQFDIGDGIQSIVQWFTDAFKGAAEWLEKVDWSELPGKIVTWISDEFKKINISGLASAIAEFVGAALGAVTGFTLGSINEIINWVDEYIYNGFHNADGSLKTGKEIVNWLLKSIAYGFVGGGAASSYDTVIKPFIEGFEKAFGSNTDAIDGVGSAFCSSLFGSIVSHLPDIGKWVKEHIVDPINAALESPDIGIFSTTYTISVIVKLIRYNWDTVSSWVKTFLGDAIGSPVSLKQNKWKTVASWINTKMGGKVIKAIGLTQDDWKDVGDWVKRFLGLPVTEPVGLSKRGWTSVSSWVSLFLGGAINKPVGLSRNGWASVAGWIISNSFLGSLSIGITLKREGWTTVIEWLKQFLGRGVGSTGQAANGIPYGTSKVVGNSGFAQTVQNSVMMAANSVAITVPSSLFATISTDNEDTEEMMFRAMSRALATFDPGDMDVNVNLDGNNLYREIVRRNRSNTRVTGVNALA